MSPRAATRTGRDLLVAVGAVAASVFLLIRILRLHNPTIAALTLLLIVLGAATLSRLAVAIVTSLVAMLAFNYFFLPPVGTFTIADPQNWVALFVFLAVGTIASQLSSIAQARAGEAIARRQEVTRLFDLSRGILLTSGTGSALPALARHVARHFELDAVAICVPDERGWTLHQGGQRDIEPPHEQLDGAFARLRGGLEYDARQRAYGGHARIRDASGHAMILVPLRLGDRPIGLLAADDHVLEVGVLDALGGVVAIAIERVHFLREREAADALKERADLASTLLASLSHDLRTPLTAIGVALTNLQDESLAPADRRAQAQLALTEIERLHRLFQDILDMARIDAAAITAEREWITPTDVIDAAIARIGAPLDHRALTIDASSDTEVQIDPKLTANALAHLLENAVQYSAPDAPIDIHGWTSAQDLHLTVRDRGPGLDPGELDHLFERFYRGKGARQHSFGTGMGLAITRGLLAAEGGQVWGENVPDGGARFSIVVPTAVRAVQESLD